MAVTNSGSVDRWGPVGVVIGAWFAASDKNGLAADEVEQAEQRLGVAFPTALREWLVRYGARSDVWRVQDDLVRLDRLQRDNDVLVIGVENQSVVWWGIEIGVADDPPVLEAPGSRLDERAWRPAAESVTTFALQNALLAVKFSSRNHHACGQCEHDMLAKVRESLARIEVPTTSFVQGEFYGSLDGPVLVEVNAETWLWVSALTEHAQGETRCLVGAEDEQWDQWVA